jgi:raffinose/stachyose/melibiose transport system substrate-binding protein
MSRTEGKMKSEIIKPGIAGAIALGLILSSAACSSDDNGGEDGGKQTTLTLLTDNAETQVKQTEALIAAFEKDNPDIKIKYETRPGGAEGDNIVKTRLSTGEMTDVFQYNAGSLFQQINPEQFIEPITGQRFLENVSAAFTPVVSVKDEIYGVPHSGASQAGGIFYNRTIYSELGLQVPKTWAEFMSNNEKIKAAGKSAVIQTYGDTHMSQIITLSDYHNIHVVDPQWADKYTNNQVKFASDPLAFRSIEKLQELFEGGYFNRDFASAKTDAGLLYLANGDGAHFPVLSGIMASIPEDKVAEVGFFAVPGDDASENGMTTWMSDGLYINKATDKKEAALKFLEYATTKESCDARVEGVGVTGPWQLNACEVPEDAPQVVKDLDAYVQTGSESPALEYLSPIKGPNLEHLLVEVGSGLATAKDAAARYDEDVKKQAQQLGIEGW